MKKNPARRPAVTVAQIESAVRRLNEMHGFNPEAVTGRAWNIGTVFSQGAYGGYQLQQVMTDGGGVRSLTSGYVPKRELLAKINEYLASGLPSLPEYARRERASNPARRKNPISKPVYHDTYNIASHFLPSLINGDDTGLDDDDINALGQWVSKMPPGIAIFQPEGNSFFGRDAVTGLQADVVETKVYVQKIGKNPARRSAKPVDEHAARELFLFAVNHEPVYRQIQAINKNLAKKKMTGTYDGEKAIQGYKHAADSAAKMYEKEFGGRGLFSPATRKQVAAMMVGHFNEEVTDALYEMKKGRVKNPASNITRPKDTIVFRADARGEAKDYLKAWNSPQRPVFTKVKSEALLMEQGIATTIGEALIGRYKSRIGIETFSKK